ncbi:tetratricopeptide repeat protein [Verticiella sediminum]|uniref:Tetratricopeptide repeat protein n=1 Tax=Verticiella sediminum TaxID=1247510 RepID=A0A556AIV6_9BURK|nr:tetratricopeptide repeat protein [Verticiella sediminum]TSH92809.1 tetratricopeptide repeat protein [Verticiella sediminum]
MTPAFERARELFFEGNAHMEAGRLTDAERCYAAALQAMPGRPSVLTNLGAVRLRLGRAADALPLLETAVAAEPDNLEAWGHLAVALGDLGRPEEAIQADDRALALNADAAPVWRHRGVMQQRLQRDEDALASFAALVRLLPERADPWLLHGEALIRLRRPDEAQASFERALAIDPDIGAAWSRLGAIFKEQGKREEAIDALQRAISLGDARELNGFLLASVTGRKAPLHAPTDYVQSLFDDYADEFDSHLVDVLNYRGHERLIAGLATHAPGRHYARGLDLGCGTGLCAPLLAPLVDSLDGVDLSGRMVEKARARGGYREVSRGDLAAYLARTPERYDLVVSADVLLYVGDLAQVFDGVQRVLRPDGVFCFTAERGEDDTDVVLLPRLTYAHSEKYLRNMALRHGLQVLAIEQHPIREDQGEPIPGLYVYVARR